MTLNRERRVINEQMKKLLSEEQRMMRRTKNRLIDEKTKPIRQLLADKTPDKMVATLRTAFEKGFRLVFEKGTGVIQKTYDTTKAQVAFCDHAAALRREKSRRNFKRLDRQAKNESAMNTGISTIEGTVLGLLGIGLPDIPLLIAVTLKTVYQVALSYGFGYESQQERLFVLHVICAAATQDDKRIFYAEAAERIAETIDAGRMPEDQIDVMIRQAASCLADAMMMAKVVQGIPLVGAVAGLTNSHLVHLAGHMARIKYKKRYLRGLISRST